MIKKSSIAMLMLLTACETKTGGTGKVDWVTDYAAGMEKAKAENKPVLLLFTADW